MDGQNGSTVTDGKKKKKIPDRVTLKKEIGLLSACTIIIGEAGNQQNWLQFCFVFYICRTFKKPADKQLLYVNI